MKEKKLPMMITAAIVVIIVVGVGSFYCGLKYGQSKRSFEGNFGNWPGASNGQNAAMTGRRIGQGGGFINGDIMSQDDKSMTVKLRDGGSKIVLFSSSTEIGRFSSGTLSDLQVNDNVMVTGKTNTDGSLTAQSIQIRPTMPTPPQPPQQ